MTTTDKEKAATTKASASDSPASADEPTGFVRFTGNGIREISSESWDSVDCKGQKESVWGPHNAHRLPVEDFSKKALNYLLNVDGQFVVED